MKNHIMIFRFSALGDVLMTVPIVDTLARTYPETEITMVSREFVRPLFEHLPENVHFIGVDFKKQYKGLKGLSKLYERLADEEPSHIADLHDVIRTKYLRWRFSVAGYWVKHINKERANRKAFLKAEHKDPQKTSFQKYVEVFEGLGFPLPSLTFTSLFGEGRGDVNELSETYRSLLKEGHEQQLRLVGIAPFAAHEGKIYPLDKMEEVVRLLSEDARNRVFLFGSGKKEHDVLKEWSAKYPGVTNMAGALESLYRESVFMSHLNVMLTMDSANMHLAALAHTPVLSIWGATHPYAGFLGWGQHLDSVIQLDMPCRPCSIYGSKPCSKGNYPCLNGIAPAGVVARILKY
jgi:ADP-heptose:LPS heptosyltransferase